MNITFAAESGQCHGPWSHFVAFHEFFYFEATEFHKLGGIHSKWNSLHET